MEITNSVVLDIEHLAQSSDGSQKKILSRKALSRIERRKGEDTESDDIHTKLLLEVGCSEQEHSRPSFVTIKCPTPVPDSKNVVSLDADGRNKRFGNFTVMHPRKILLFFASISCLGTLVLIYFTLAINYKGRI